MNYYAFSIYCFFLLCKMLNGDTGMCVHDVCITIAEIAICLHTAFCVEASGTLCGLNS